MLWTTHHEGKGKSLTVRLGQGTSCGGQANFQNIVVPSLASSHNGADSHSPATEQASERPRSARTRSGMSLSEYLSKKAQIERNN